MNILLPSLLKVIPRGLSSWPLTEKLVVKLAEETSYGVLKSYSKAASPWIPTTYILEPSLLKVIPFGMGSSEFTEKVVLEKLAVETSGLA